MQWPSLHVISHNVASFRANCVKFSEVKLILLASEMQPKGSFFGCVYFTGMTHTISASWASCFSCSEVLAIWFPDHQISWVSE